jgi:hypothetical protein
LKPYRGNYGDGLKLPGKNEGLTYVASGFGTGSNIDSIKIAPMIDDEQCSSSDETFKIDNCVLLVNN